MVLLRSRKGRFEFLPQLSRSLLSRLSKSTDRPAEPSRWPIVFSGIKVISLRLEGFFRVREGPLNLLRFPTGLLDIFCLIECHWKDVVPHAPVPRSFGPPVPPRMLLDSPSKF